MEKEEFMKKLNELYLKKKYLSMNGEDSKEVDEQIKKVKKEYANSLIKEKNENDKHKRR